MAGKILIAFNCEKFKINLCLLRATQQLLDHLRKHAHAGRVQSGRRRDYRKAHRILGGIPEETERDRKCKLFMELMINSFIN